MYAFLMFSASFFLLSSFSCSISASVLLNRFFGTGLLFTSLGIASGGGITFGFGFVKLNGFCCVGAFFGLSSSSDAVAGFTDRLCVSPPVAAKFVYSLPCVALAAPANPPAVADSAAVDVVFPVALFSIVLSMSATLGKFFSMSPMTFSSMYA